MINSIRVLRALAAWVVVWHHGVQIFYGFDVESFWLSMLAKYGSIGVDLFFVISGFVIYYSVFDKKISPLKFAGGRVVRIVPVYWFYSLSVAALAVLSPGFVPLTEYDHMFLLKSLLFLPEDNPSGVGYFPILTVGWTLNYEMAFYAVFALALMLERRLLIPILVLGIVLLESFMHKLGGDLEFYNNSMVYEFLFGIFVCVLHKNGWLKINACFSLILIFSGLAVVLMSNGVTHSPVKFGLPCAAIFVGFLSLEGFFTKENILMRLGDWSYSTYLCHILVVAVVFQASKIYAQVPFWVWMVLITIVVVAMSRLSYKFIERPCVDWLRMLQTRQAVGKMA